MEENLEMCHNTNSLEHRIEFRLICSREACVNACCNILNIVLNNHRIIILGG